LTPNGLSSRFVTSRQQVGPLETLRNWRPVAQQNLNGNTIRLPNEIIRRHAEKSGFPKKRTHGHGLVNAGY
jgi:hypothetical protein